MWLKQVTAKNLKAAAPSPEQDPGMESESCQDVVETRDKKQESKQQALLVIKVLEECYCLGLELPPGTEKRLYNLHEEAEIVHT